MGEKITLPEKHELFGETEYEQLKTLYKNKLGKWDKEVADTAFDDTVKGTAPRIFWGWALAIIGFLIFPNSILVIAFVPWFIGWPLFFGSLLLMGYGRSIMKAAHKKRQIGEAMKQYMAVDPALTSSSDAQAPNH